MNPQFLEKMSKTPDFNSVADFGTQNIPLKSSGSPLQKKPYFEYVDDFPEIKVSMPKSFKKSPNVSSFDTEDFGSKPKNNKFNIFETKDISKLSDSESEVMETKGLINKSLKNREKNVSLSSTLKRFSSNLKKNRKDLDSLKIFDENLTPRKPFVSIDKLTEMLNILMKKIKNPDKSLENSVNKVFSQMMKKFTAEELIGLNDLFQVRLPPMIMIEKDDTLKSELEMKGKIYNEIDEKHKIQDKIIKKTNEQPSEERMKEIKNLENRINDAENLYRTKHNEYLQKSLQKNELQNLIKESFSDIILISKEFDRLSFCDKLQTFLKKIYNLQEKKIDRLTKNIQSTQQKNKEIINNIKKRLAEMRQMKEQENKKLEKLKDLQDSIQKSDEILKDMDLNVALKKKDNFLLENSLKEKIGNIENAKCLIEKLIDHNIELYMLNEETNKYSKKSELFKENSNFQFNNIINFKESPISISSSQNSSLIYKNESSLNSGRDKENTTRDVSYDFENEVKELKKEEDILIKEKDELIKQQQQNGEIKLNIENLIQQKTVFLRVLAKEQMVLLQKNEKSKGKLWIFISAVFAFLMIMIFSIKIIFK